MSGIMEILVIVAIIVGIIMLPRIMNRRDGIESQQLSHKKKVPGWARVAIVVSILWLTLVALYLKPWQGQIYIFLFVALGPILLVWGALWVYLGFRKDSE